jgi:predicted nuclease of restriction endonuclease-like (RecB) superfamily
MSTRRKHVSRAIVHQPAAQFYDRFVEGIKKRIRTAQIKAALSANRELILLYWDIGRAIVEAQKNKGYGKRVVEMLSADLRREFPAMSGLSALNLWRMRAFYLAYGASDQKLSQAVTESGSAPRKMKQPVSASAAQRAMALQPAGQSQGQKLSQAVTESPGAAIDLLALLPWGHNIVLFQKLKELDTRLWYARAALEYGWSRSVLLIQIESRLHKRQGRAITNFTATLPAPQSDLAHQTLKDPYIFDFLAMDADARERDLELGLLNHIQKFLVELGVGFALVGRQYRLEVSGEEFFLDLLFYHLRLRCFVVVDLKMEAFKPEFAGKMNFYLSAVDNQLRHRDDQPSIGLLLCKERNRLIVEYALRDVTKPIGVAEWRTRLVESLPKKLQTSLPTVKQIEAELSVELEPVTLEAKGSVGRNLSE